MHIHDYLKKDGILFLDTESKKETIKAMIEHARQTGKLTSSQDFEKSIFDREKIVSTGLGLGVAVPHAKIATIEKFFIVAAILSHDVDWDAIDKRPVRLVFLIGGPDNQQADYLRILAKIVLITKNPALREKLLAATRPEEVVEIFGKM